MAKTTIEGWSLDKHSEFLKRLDGKRHRPIRRQRKTLKAELSTALGYYEYKDTFGCFQSKMVEAMTKEEDWYKVRRGDVE